MKKRNRIKVLGEWVTLEHCDLKSEAGKDEDLWGDCNVGRRTIRIEEAIEGEEYTRVLRHEIFHMKLGISGIGELLSPELEEALAVLAESQ